MNGTCRRKRGERHAIHGCAMLHHSIPCEPVTQRQLPPRTWRLRCSLETYRLRPPGPPLHPPPLPCARQRSEGPRRGSVPRAQPQQPGRNRNASGHTTPGRCRSRIPPEPAECARAKRRGMLILMPLAARRNAVTSHPTVNIHTMRWGTSRRPLSSHTLHARPSSSATRNRQSAMPTSLAPGICGLTM